MTAVLSVENEGHTSINAREKWLWMDSAPSLFPTKHLLKILMFVHTFTKSHKHCHTRVFHDFQFSQGDWLFDIIMGVEVHDKKIKSSLLGASQV